MRDYLNDEQRQLADSLERYLEREHPIPESGIPCCAAGQPISASGHWGEFANFGLLALTVDESRGGIQDDPIAVHAIMEHFGRHLVLEPYVATVVQAASLLAATGTEQLASELLALVLAGDCQIAMAHAEEQTDYSLHNVSTRAEVLEQGWVLDGHKVGVRHAQHADMWLVLARTRGSALQTDGLSLFMVRPQTSGIRVRSYFNIDGSPASDIWFDRVQLPKSSLLGELHLAWPLFEHICARANAALCAESVGIMSAVLEATLGYVRERKQFGSSIGSFQAIQHRLVDMYMQLEKSRSLSQKASAMLRSEDFLAAVSAAKAMCCQAARFICQSAIQLHGGIGMTDELALGKFVKRLLVLSHTLGDEQHHVQQFARLAQSPSAMHSLVQH
ncbi:acyl-CoA dehydrogenase [Comamonas thiooxydans]|uniref:Acyl-CoA dehydrogenase n=1 Tax=Comamonas thiooxydans TaxID=363952 RepID=A0AA42Q1X0_9BURK|nr:acyl-CoA dehydrogenase [Comamonas thiooxydans]MDH1334664.1 acyl-CoA dehydrogenase [Comamonas thiooxydans]MDH1740891.1 acyl-CoA dehydrogenase [Comamonas thiooxydans]MDH1787084.1 acyl-CoA dehydrogenase [Comamonas thiooxydans]